MISNAELTMQCVPLTVWEHFSHFSINDAKNMYLEMMDEFNRMKVLQKLSYQCHECEKREDKAVIKDTFHLVCWRLCLIERFP